MRLTTLKSAIDIVEQFIADELEVRKASMLPADTTDFAYIKAAEDALKAVKYIARSIGVTK